MALYEVTKIFVVNNPNEIIKVSVDHNSLVGTESYHIIDVPFNDAFYDHEWRNEGNVAIGRGTEFIDKEIKIYSKAINIKPDVDDIQINYSINNQVSYEHSNLKKDDLSPSIALSIKFKK